MENSMERPLKKKKNYTELPQDPTISPLGMYPENKATLQPNGHSSTIYKSQDMEATYVSINRWMDEKMWHIQIMGYYSDIKKNEIMPFAATWVDLKSIILSEAKSDRERQISYGII